MNTRYTRIHLFLAVALWAAIIGGVSTVHAQARTKTSEITALENRATLAAKLKCPQESAFEIASTDDGIIFKVFVRSKTFFAYGRTFQVKNPGWHWVFRPNTAALPNDGVGVVLVREPKPYEDPCWELFAIQ